MERVVPRAEPVPEVNVEQPDATSVNLADLEKAVKNVLDAEKQAEAENITVAVQGDAMSEDGPEEIEYGAPVVNIAIPGAMGVAPTTPVLSPVPEGVEPSPTGVVMPTVMPNVIPQPPQILPQPPQQMGGMMPVVQPGMVGGNQIITIDTSMEAMQRDGLDVEGTRPLRRRYMGGAPQVNLQLGPSLGPSSGPSSGPSLGPSLHPGIGHSSGSSMGILTINKLE